MYNSPDYFTLMKAANGVYYYYAYEPSGRRIKRSTGRRSKKEALAEITRRIRENILLEDPGMNQRYRMTFGEFAEPFWIWESCPIIRDKIARGGHYSADLCISNRRSMEKHILSFFGSKRLVEITRKDIDDWILGLPSAHGISANTANKMLSLMKQMLRVAVNEGIIPSSPAETVSPLVEKEKRRGAFTEDDVKRIFSIEWSSDLAYTAAFLSAFTGMRLGEVRALRPSRIHDGYILVDSSWSDTSGIKTTKSGKARVVPITKRIQTMLRKASEGRADDELIFSSDGKVPFDDKRFSCPLKETMGKLGIDFYGRNLSFHSFRHFFNTQIVAAGVSGEIVRNIVGHESIEMTDRYLHLGSNELSAVRKVQLDLSRDIRRDRLGN